MDAGLKRICKGIYKPEGVNAGVPILDRVEVIRFLCAAI